LRKPKSRDKIQKTAISFFFRIFVEQKRIVVMTKKLFFVSAFILSVIVVDGRDPVPHSSVNMDEVSFYPQSSNIVSHFTSLSLQQLYDTANYYFRKNSTDTALICFYLLIATTPKTADIEYQKRAIRARNRSAMIYFFRSDYRKVYELFVL